MDYRDQIREFVPQTDQEVNDKRIILELIARYPQNILLRENELAHITSSGLVVNESFTRVLFVHHNIYKTWCWTGGHADGGTDLLGVALREVMEETGGTEIRPLSDQIVSLDILPVYGHYKNGKYVSAHLHLNASFLLVGDDSLPLRAKEDENTGAAWFRIDEIDKYSGEPELIRVYRKIFGRIPGLCAR